MARGFKIAVSLAFALTVTMPTTEAQGDQSERTGGGGAFFLGGSPIYRPKIGASDRLNIGNFINFDLGFESKSHAIFGFRFAKLTVPSLETYNPLTFVTSRTENNSATNLEIFAGGLIPLNESYGTLGPVQLFVPVYFGSALFSINKGSDTYRAIALDSAAGLGIRMYTYSIFRADLSALYHYGIPITPFLNSADSLSTVRNSAAEEMKVNLTGFEFRIGLSILFSNPEPEPVADTEVKK